MKKQQSSSCKDDGGDDSPTDAKALPKKKSWKMTSAGFQEAVKSGTNLERYIFMPPTSSSLSSPPENETFGKGDGNKLISEDCFLSHRGPDKKMDLVAPFARMMTALYGMTFFVDCEATNMKSKAQEGNKVNVLRQALWACRVVVVFLSKNFHESIWCLKELYTVMYRRQRESESLILHIVYCDGMDPGQCRAIPEYQSLSLGDFWGTVYNQGTSLQDFATTHLHRTILQFIRGDDAVSKTPDETVAAWRKVCRVRFGIPDAVPYFQGRKRELAQLSNIFKDRASPVIATHGVGGVGKSQLVVSWVHQNLAHYHLVAWIRAEHEFALVQDLAQLGEKDMGLEFADSENMNQKAQRTLKAIEIRSTYNSPGLVVFDNAKSYSTLNDQGWLPELGRYCHALLTTRDCSGSSEDDHVTVGPLDQGSSLAVVNHFLRRSLLEAEIPHVLKILQSFDFLPLAVVSFAAFARKFGLDDAFQAVEPVFFQRKIHDQRNYKGEQRDTVHAVLRAQVLSLDDDARTMLNYLSVLAPENVPRPFLKTLVGNTISYHCALETLMDCAIVLVKARDNSVSTHRLLQSTTVVLSRSEGRLGSILEHVAKVLNKTTKEGFDKTFQHDRKYLLPLFPHITAVTNQTWPEESSSLGYLLQCLGLLLFNEAQYLDSLHASKRSLSILQRPSCMADAATTLNNIGVAHEKLGEFKESLSTHKKALDIRRDVLGPTHIEVGTTLNNMAVVFQNQGNFQDAMSRYEQALSIQTKTLGPNHHHVASTMMNMGIVYEKLGKYEAAMSQYENALVIRMDQLGPTHIEVANTLHNMGIVHEKRKEFKLALSKYKQSLDIERRQLDPKHLSIAESLHSIANVYTEMGSCDAISNYQEALGIQKEKLGPASAEVAETLISIALVHKKQREYNQAISISEEALDIYRRSLHHDENHPVVTRISNIVNDCVNKQKRLEDRPEDNGHGSPRTMESQSSMLSVPSDNLLQEKEVENERLREQLEAMQSQAVSLQDMAQKYRGKNYDQHSAHEGKKTTAERPHRPNTPAGKKTESSRRTGSLSSRSSVPNEIEIESDDDGVNWIEPAIDEEWSEGSDEENDDDEDDNDEMNSGSQRSRTSSNSRSSSIVSVSNSQKSRNSHNLDSSSGVHQVTALFISDRYGEEGTYTGSLSISTGMPHGVGRLEYDKAGRWYEGDWRHGWRTGQGRLSNGDGDLYEGGLQSDKKHGQGMMKFADGRIFEGEYINGQMVEGKMTYEDGSTYTGGWVDGLRHGRGRCEFTDQSVYKGEFREGEFWGFGRMSWSDGGWYEGEWKNGEMQGVGKEVRSDGSLRHEGLWSNGQPVRK